MDPQLLAYLTFTLILVVTPGSTTAVVVRNTLIGGRTAGLASAVGAAMGNAIHATAAGLGLAIVFARWPLTMTLLRLAGASYLAWLGLRSISRVVQHADGGIRMLTPAESDARGTSEHAGSLRQGLVVNLLNPAIATFYLVVVPSFLPGGAASRYFVALAAIHLTLAFACHSLWALALDKLRRMFRPPLARRVLEAATGVALLGLAYRVLLR